MCQGRSKLVFTPLVAPLSIGVYTFEFLILLHSLVSDYSRNWYTDKLTYVVDRPHHQQLPFVFFAHKSKLYGIHK